VPDWYANLRTTRGGAGCGSPYHSLDRTKYIPTAALPWPLAKRLSIRRSGLLPRLPNPAPRRPIAPPMPFSFADIEALFARLGDRAYAGEPVSQLEHALQSGLLAEQAGAGPALVTAAFLHDLGHLINDQGESPTLRGIDDRHEFVAIPRLRELFGPAVLQPIRLHVAAKRYLCMRGNREHGGPLSGPQYLAALSADSRRSLQLQGGVFSEAEADAFIGQPHAADAVRLRLWDDAAKVAALPTPPLSHYLAIAAAVAQATPGAKGVQ